MKARTANHKGFPQTHRQRSDVCGWRQRTVFRLSLGISAWWFRANLVLTFFHDCRANGRGNALVQRGLAVCLSE